jgi:FKBP12-rapamycin complex-associated protein
VLAAGFSAKRAEVLNSHGSKSSSLLDVPRRIDMEQLRSWLAVNTLVSRDWLHWLSYLRIQLIINSPSFAIRACGTLAKTNDALSKDLFNAAFM